MTGSTFLPVSGGTAVGIQDIVPKGDNIDNGDVVIQTLDAYGYTQDNYVYYGEDCYDDGYPAGWYTDEGELASATFAQGQGLWTYAIDSETSVMFSGAVPKSDVSVTLRLGAMGTLNMMPVNVAIQDILPEGDDTDNGDVVIQVLDAFGYTSENYVYYGEDCYDDGYPAGWYTDDGELASRTFTPGEGLWVYAIGSNTSIRIPAPEL